MARYAFFVAVILAAFGVSAEERDPWIGKTVLLRPGAVLTKDDAVVDGRFLALPATVQDADEERVWLGRGWANKADVMDADAALALCDERIKADPKDAATWKLRGLAWVAKQEARQAIWSFDEAIRIAPAADAYLYRASAHATKSEYLSALQDCDDAIRLDPTNPINFVRRAFARTKLKDFDKAIQDCTRAVELDAECDAALKLRGDAHLWQGNPDDAIKDFDESLRCNPKNAAAFRARAFGWVEKKDYVKALLDLDEAILLQPQNALSFRTRGVCHLGQEKPQQAIADFSQAIQRDPNQASLYDLRSAAHIANGDFFSALQDSEKTVHLDPNDVSGHTHLAILLATCGDAKIRDGKKAVNHGVWACGLSDWKYDQAIAVLAAAYAEAGDWENAIRFQKIVIEMSKDEQQKLEWEKSLISYEKREPLRLFKDLKPSQFVPTLARP